MLSGLLVELKTLEERKEGIAGLFRKAKDTWRSSRPASPRRPRSTLPTASGELEKYASR